MHPPSFVGVVVWLITTATTATESFSLSFQSNVTIRKGYKIGGNCLSSVISRRRPPKKSTSSSRLASSFVPGDNTDTGTNKQIVKGWVGSSEKRRLFLARLSERVGIVASAGAFLPVEDAIAIDEKGSGGSASAVKNKKEEPSVVAKKLKVISEKLGKVPTFAIVDKRGVPYMVVGDDAKVTSYFFTTYKEASRLLKIATESSEKAVKEYDAQVKEMFPEEEEEKDEEKSVAKKGGVGPPQPKNPWIGARISTVPLDVAVTLEFRTLTTSSGGSYFKVAPAEEDVTEALELDTSGKKDLPEGKVPLFYIDDFEFENDETTINPLYFRKSQLISEYKKRNRGKKMPEIMVTELFSVVNAMVKQSQQQVDSGEDDLDKLFFVPPVESEKMAQECKKIGGKEEPFRLGERIIVL